MIISTYHRSPGSLILTRQAIEYMIPLNREQFRSTNKTAGTNFNIAIKAAASFFRLTVELRRLPMKTIINICFAVIFVTVGATSVFADALTGTKWNWVSAKTPAGTTSIDKPENYTLDFRAGGRVVVKADCNNGNGTYKVKGRSLTFGPIATTRMLCPEGSMDSKFLMGLDAARFYRVVGNVLTIQLASDGGLMTFTRAGSNPFPGTKWKWTHTQTPKETFTPTVPANYTLEFLVGTVNVKADCNTGSGKYTVNTKDSTIKLGPIAISMMACPEGSLDSRFLQQLDAARIYTIEGDTLRLDLFADSGTMHFSKVGAESANPLKGTAWNWVNTKTGGKTVTVSQPRNYTLTFLTENTVSAQLDCNRGNGGYTVDGNKLTFGPMATTMMACPPGSLGGTFGIQLGKAQTFKIVGDRLSIELADGAGTMNFVRPSK